MKKIFIPSNSTLFSILSCKATTTLVFNKTHNCLISNAVIATKSIIEIATID